MLIKRRERNAEEARAKALAKEREKRRKTMLRTKYGQTPLRHAKKGILSCVLSAAASFLVFLLFSSSFVLDGQIGLSMGAVGIVVLFLAIDGLLIGLKGFKERNKNYVTCKIGVAWNGLLTLGMCVIFIRGLF